MGNYNNEYEGYYGKILEKQRRGANYRGYNGTGYSRGSYRDENRSNNNKPLFDFSKEGIFKRIMQELIGVLCLMILVVICKTVNIPQIDWLYSYGKNVVNENFDYKQVINYDYGTLLAKVNVNFSNSNDLRTELENYVETFKSKFTGEKTQKDEMKDTFISPLKGTILENSEKEIGDKGVIIQGDIDEEVVCVYEGTVKKLGDDPKLGKYMIIDHGNGVESKYSNLKETELKEGDSVGKGELIGKVDENKGLNIKGVIFQLFIMGTAKNPLEYMQF